MSVLLPNNDPPGANPLADLLPDSVAVRLCRVDQIAPAVQDLAAGNLDVVLLDLTRLAAQGLEALALCRQQAPGVPVVVLTHEENDDLARQAMSLGAGDCLPRHQATAYLLARVLRHAVHVRRLEVWQEASLAALLASEERFRLLFERTPIPYQSLNTDGRLVEVNQAWLDALGYERDDVIGVWFGSLLDEDDIELFRARFPLLKQRGAVSGVEFTLHRNDGTLIIVSFEGRVGYNLDGTFRQTHCVFQDITERKQAETLLHRRVEQLGVLNDIGSRIAAVLDLDQVLDRAASLVHSRFGYDHVALFILDRERRVLALRAHRGDVVARPLHPDHHLALGQGMVGWVGLCGETLLANDVSHEPRYVDLFPGQGRTCSELSVPIRMGTDVLGVIDVQSPRCQAFDQDDVRAMETLAGQIAGALHNAHLYQALQDQMDELTRTQAQLVHAAKMAALGELSAGVAHELNNPLTGVLGFAELLLEDPTLRPDQRQDLATITHEARRARDIVRNLLDFCRQSDPHPRWLDLNQVVRESLDLVRQQLAKSGVEVVERYAAALPPLFLDGSRLKQVVLNLVTNAGHAMDGRGILTVSSDIVGQEVAVRVADTGCGIPASNLEHLFEPFFTTKPVDQGTGLGLAVSLGIVQAHGGRIDVESEPGRGSTFTIWLPLPPAPQE